MELTQILVVENEIIIAKDIQNRLKNLGYGVPAIVVSGEEALLKVEEIQPHLILMDIKLRGKMDGIETAAKITKRFNIPIIYLTAYADPNTLQRAKETEPFGYVFKPFEDREVYTAIEVALHKHRIEQKQRTNERWFAATLKCIGDAVITVDQKGMITFINTVAERLTGFSLQKAQGKPIQDVFKMSNGQQENVANQALFSALNQYKENSGYCYLNTQEQHQIPIDLNVASILDDSGELTGLVLSFRDITARQHAEEALRDSEEKFRSLVENAPDFIICTDQNGRISFINRTTPSFTQESVIGTSMYDYIDAEYHLISKQKLDNVFQKGEPDRYEIKGLGIHQPSWYSTHVAPLKHGNEVVAAMFISRDITERIQMENALRESERKGKAILDAVPDVMFRISRSGEMIDYKMTTPNRFPVTLEPRIGNHLQQIFPSDFAQELFEHLEKALEDQTIQIFEKKILVANEFKIFEVRLVVSGKDEVVTIIRDISERKQAEERITHRLVIEEAIAHASRLFVTPKDADLFQVLTVLGRAFQATHAFIFQLKNRGHIAQKIAEWKENSSVLHWEGIEFETQRFSWWMKKLEACENIEIFNIQALPEEANFEREWLSQFEFCSFLCIPIFSSNQTLMGFLGLIEQHRKHSWPAEDAKAIRVIGEMIGNYWERKRTEKERQLLESQIQHSQKLESLGILSGGIAHDFNNLLMGILGNASLALMDIKPEDPARYSLQQIEIATLRAAELVSQLLAYSGKGKILVQKVEISKLVEEMIALLKTVISKKIILECHFIDDLPFIEADPTQLRQVVMNLITNAADAIGEQTGRITIQTGFLHATREYLSQMYLDEQLPEGDYVFLQVEDTGSGMDQETLTKIFDPFFTTKFTGRGLGLASVLGIVRSHFGALKVISQPGQGTRFRVLFPVKAHIAEKTSTIEVVTEEWKGSGTVLIIDDEESVRITVRRMLERLGFSVLMAQDGREGVEMFEQHGSEIVLVLLDVTMPQMNGKEVLQALRKKDTLLPVLLSSGHSEQDISAQFGVQENVCFIQKPYLPIILTQKLKLLLSV